MFCHNGTVRRPHRSRTFPSSSAQALRRFIIGMALAAAVVACGQGDGLTTETASGVTSGAEALTDAAREATASDAATGDTTATTASTGEESQAVETAAPVLDEEPPAEDAALAANEAADETEPTAVPEPIAAPIDPHLFSNEIMPILETVCAQCHTPGGPAAHDLEFATAQSVADAAQEIHWVTQTGLMPPWLASDLSVDFRNDYTLTEDQLDSISRWVDGGALIDVDPTTAIVSTVPRKVLDERDLVVTSVDGPYQGSTAVLDDYRCVIFDPQITETQWILAESFEADQVTVAHHAITTLASQEKRALAEAQDAADPGVGWRCYGGHGLDKAEGGYAFGLGGWAPGRPPSHQPEGYGIPLRPGDFIVVQMHYHFADEAPADLSRMVFDLASPEELAAVDGQFKTLRGALYLGPAEIPCYAGDTNPLCDRDAALQRVFELYGNRARFIPDFMLAQCDATPADYVDMTDGTAWSTCDLKVRNPGRIHSLGAHMHELGLAFRMTLNPDTPDGLILLDIPDWDFEWQFGYQPVDDIWITKDDVIRVECTWNRERAPYDAEGYVLWAEGTGDEMCYSGITTAPEAPPT